MLVTMTSQLSGMTNTIEIDITEEQLDRVFNRRTNGELIQHIVPELSKDHREFLITGITPEEWEEAFAPEDEM